MNPIIKDETTIRYTSRNILETHVVKFKNSHLPKNRWKIWISNEETNTNTRQRVLAIYLSCDSKNMEDHRETIHWI
ncbi:unnamed protein product [Caenorhabditis angaria]|uniref:Uncharacterized protein n=1 Tax=Caenorhabditis angaria TaxID=860376 RepID=A0A9P1MXW9_9PELO|nr:unnamed protein product [Caenorhabditis angaria]